MVARGALWNASIFRAEGKSSWEDIKREYMRKCILWDNDVKSTKHTLKEMIMHYSCLEFDEGKAVTKSKTIADLAEKFMSEKCVEEIKKLSAARDLEHQLVNDGAHNNALIKKSVE